MNIYDDIPYPNLTFSQSHPNRLASIAMLLGLDPAPVHNCRVLELGCAIGGNIIPMAYALPNSTFVGLDYSAKQIAAGQKVVDDLGLTNIQLLTRDILDGADDLGEFDYIIAHGVYSWVPEPVREALMAICRDNLAPNGIAYISYNTLPGWHMLGAIRQMMLYHTRHTDAPLEKVAEARALIDFLSEATPKENHMFGSFLNSYADLMQDRRTHAKERMDTLMLHDELEEVNDAVYFHEFAAHADKYGLQYVAESAFPTVMPTNFRPETAERLMAMSDDVIEIEQYMDFIRNRTFRQTLLCHKDQTVSRNVSPDPSLLRKFTFSTRATPVEDDEQADDDTLVVRAPDGARFSTNHPVSKCAFEFLAYISPYAMSFDQILSVARQKVYGNTEGQEDDAEILASNLLRGFTYSLQLVELHAYRPGFTIEVRDKPVASTIARYQVINGEKKVANLRHERVSLDPLTHYILPYLDGSRSRNELLGAVWHLVQTGKISLPDSADDKSEAKLQELMVQELDRGLQWLARAALLLA